MRFIFCSFLGVPLGEGLVLREEGFDFGASQGAETGYEGGIGIVVARLGVEEGGAIEGNFEGFNRGEAFSFGHFFVLSVLFEHWEIIFREKKTSFELKLGDFLRQFDKNN
jgi:hypothetical protein